MKFLYGVMLNFWSNDVTFLLYNQFSHSIGWWHHCLSATHVGSFLWPVLGARRHPWVWLLFHRSLAGEFRQVCIPDRMAKVMTDITVWDTLDIYFLAMSDLAAPVSSREWTCSPAISSYIQNVDSTIMSIGPLCNNNHSQLLEKMMMLRRWAVRKQFVSGAYLWKYLSDCLQILGGLVVPFGVFELWPTSGSELCPI